MNNQTEHLKTLENFSRKFGKMISSGIPLVRSLSIVIEETSDPSFSAVLTRIMDNVKQGKVFSDSLALFPGYFSQSFIGMVKAGESQGLLDEVMLKIADGLNEGTIDPASGDAKEVVMNQDVADDPNASMIRLVNEIIMEAITQNASDIHLIPTSEGLSIKFRVTGQLVDYQQLDKSLQAGCISRIKIMSCLDVAEKRLPQDGRIQIKIHGKKYDIRIATTPSVFGEKCTMRVLVTDGIKLKPKDIFTDAEDQAEFEKMISLPYGMVICAGPTGSGKTTTLLTAVSELNTGKVAISTVEDPVEYAFDGVTQVMVRAKIGLTFPAAIRSVLRSDPDIVMIGEIRDDETYTLALKTAVTGHLVLTQLHSLDVYDTVKRLMHMEAPAHLLSSALGGIISQRLVRRVCPHCAQEVEVSASAMQQYGQNDFKNDLDSFKGTKTMESEGCEKCNFTGGMGRLAIYELYRPSKAFKDALLTGSFERVLEVMSKEKFKTLRQAALTLVREGKITLREAWRATSDRL